ncbi:MAG TPA: phosphatidylglycerol lysyltransferase domain-containing protein [Vicinamibacterales bacterium]|jgi:phosphatidylglycerol lysyltransferase
MFAARLGSRSAPVSAAALATFGSGLLNLLSAARRGLPPSAMLRSIFPLEFVPLSRILTVLLGVALLVASINVYKRKRRALEIVAGLSAISIAFHVVKGGYEEAICSVVLLCVLLASRDEYDVRSGAPDWRGAATVLGCAAAVVAGYWETRAALLHSAPKLAALGQPLQLTIGAAAIYTTFSAFRPAAYRMRTLPEQRAAALRLTREHGQSALDFFKVWPEKSIFFGPTRSAFLAYRVSTGMAVVLGDPVGRDIDIERIVRSFVAECNRNDWAIAFYQTLPCFLSTYRQLGFSRLKIGDDAIVDLDGFAIDHPERKWMRTLVRKLEAAGVRYEHIEPPISDAVLDAMHGVSNEWLQRPGRRERQFALGYFERNYLRTTAVEAAFDREGRMLAFVNTLVSERRLEATGDLMRRSTDAPNGIMDYVFIKTFLRSREQGLHRFSLGMAPMAGFSPSEHASPEERAVHAFFQQLGFLFSYRGLKAYKSKFATSWEPRFVVYRHVLDLPRLAVALVKLSEMRTR